MGDAPGPDVKSPDPHLARWVTAGLITAQQAEAIAAFERGEAAAQPGRASLVAEALAYLGAALAVGAGLVTLGQVWEELGDAGGGAVLGVAAALLFAGGWWLRGATEQAIRRLMSVLWFLSVAAAAGCAAALTPVGERDGGGLRVLAAGLAATVYGGALYAARRRALQLLAVTAGLVTAVLGALLLGREEPPSWFGVAFWAPGVLVLLLGWRRVLTPVRAAYAIGSVAALLGPMFAESLHSPMLFLGLVTAAALMAWSVAARDTLLLGLGAAGVFVFVTRIVLQYFGETLGPALALLVGGVALALVALVTVRLRPLAGRGRAP